MLNANQSEMALLHMVSWASFCHFFSLTVESMQSNLYDHPAKRRVFNFAHVCLYVRR